MKYLNMLMIAILGLTIGLYVAHKKQDDGLRIAIFTPITHAALQEIEQGFKETLQKESKQPFVFTTYNANGNKTLQRAQAQEIILGKYDLVFSIGTSCTQLLSELAKKMGKIKPHVFCSIDDPVGLHIVKSLEFSGNHITGVIESTNYEQQLDVLTHIKPDTKNVMLVYDPNVVSGREHEAVFIEQFLQKKGIKLHVVALSQSSEIQQKVGALLSGIDLILVLKDNTIVAGIDSLITLANRYKIPLFVSDLNSGAKGAAVAFGIREYDSGVGAAQKASAILAGSKKPSQLPITNVQPIKLVFNKQAMDKQNLTISTQVLETIKNLGVEVKIQ